MSKFNSATPHIQPSSIAANQQFSEEIVALISYPLIEIHLKKFLYLLVVHADGYLISRIGL